MAGSLTIGTLSDGTNSTSSTNCIQGSAKAWVNYNGVANTTRASYNVQGVTRNSTDVYTITFTNAFSDTSYAVVCGGSNAGSTGVTTGAKNDNSSAYTNKTTSAVQISSYVITGSPDVFDINVACFR